MNQKKREENLKQGVHTIKIKYIFEKNIYLIIIYLSISILNPRKTTYINIRPIVNIYNSPVSKISSISTYVLSYIFSVLS